MNRLIQVQKNGTIVAEYAYDPEGYRVVKQARNETIHYVFEGTEPVFEKNITKGQVKSYIYALGKHLARVDGVLGDPETKVYYYHTDHLGSVRAVTNQAGEIVWNADYLAFGTRFGEEGSSGFAEWHGFTGKEYDPDTGLYYFNARWYDSELGRFISEDPARDPNNPNLYTYYGNNPLVRIDPTGMLLEGVGNMIKNAINSVVNTVKGWFSGGGGSSNSGGSSGGSSPAPTQTVNPSGIDSSNNSTPTTVTVDSNQVVVKDNAGNVVTTYFRDDMKSDLQRLAQLQQNAVSNPTAVNIDAAKNFANRIKKDYKEFFDATKDNQGGVSVIGLRGWGVGYPCSDTKNIQSNDIYDDMLIVMGTDGAMDVLTRCNFEGTTAVGSYPGGKLNDKGYPSIADGKYDLNSWNHKGNYDNVILSSDGSYRLPTLGKNNQYPERDPAFAEGIEIHRGGDDWTWSEGCITIYAPSGDESRWNRFMFHFPAQPKGTRVGSFNLMTL